jgi:hypothetical protein
MEQTREALKKLNVFAQMLPNYHGQPVRHLRAEEFRTASKPARSAASRVQWDGAPLPLSYKGITGGSLDERSRQRLKLFACNFRKLVDGATGCFKADADLI